MGPATTFLSRNVAMCLSGIFNTSWSKTRCGRRLANS
jgi:hypothetical protein